MNVAINSQHVCDIRSSNTVIVRYSDYSISRLNTYFWLLSNILISRLKLKLYTRFSVESVTKSVNSVNVSKK